jgi:hypothetical protein
MASTDRSVGRARCPAGAGIGNEDAYWIDVSVDGVAVAHGMIGV